MFLISENANTACHTGSENPTDDAWNSVWKGAGAQETLVPLPPAAHLSQEGTQGGWRELGSLSEYACSQLTACVLTLTLGLAQMPAPVRPQPLPPTPAPGKDHQPNSHSPQGHTTHHRQGSFAFYL